MGGKAKAGATTTTSPPVVLVADPAWKMRDSCPGNGRGAAKHYQCLSLDRIALYPLPPEVQLAQNAVLFLWRLSAMQEEALMVARSWGFKPHSELVWEKLTPTGKRHFGMGHLVRGAHETCLIAVRGRARPAVRDTRSIFSGAVGLHSEKPEAFYNLVERMYPHSPRFELFARRTRMGWQQQGRQLGKLDRVPLAVVREQAG
jgi:N6-adenosine-specific RNA methylase IME4